MKIGGRDKVVAIGLNRQSFTGTTWCTSIFKMRLEGFIRSFKISSTIERL